MKSHGALKLQSMDYEATDGILMVFFWVWFLLKDNRLKTRLSIDLLGRSVGSPLERKGQVGLEATTNRL